MVTWVHLDLRHVIIYAVLVVFSLSYTLILLHSNTNLWFILLFYFNHKHIQAATILHPHIQTNDRTHNKKNKTYATCSRFRRNLTQQSYNRIPGTLQYIASFPAESLMTLTCSTHVVPLILSDLQKEKSKYSCTHSNS